MRGCTLLFLELICSSLALQCISAAVEFKFLWETTTACDLDESDSQIFFQLQGTLQKPPLSQMHSVCGHVTHVCHLDADAGS